MLTFNVKRIPLHLPSVDLEEIPPGHLGRLEYFGHCHNHVAAAEHVLKAIKKVNRSL